MTRTGVRVLQPLLQQRHQFAHVLEAQVERLEARDRRLREVVAVPFAHRQSHVALCEAQFDATQFERLGKLLEVLQISGLFGRGGWIEHSGHQRRVGRLGQRRRLVHGTRCGGCGIVAGDVDLRHIGRCGLADGRGQNGGRCGQTRTAGRALHG